MKIGDFNGYYTEYKGYAISLERIKPLVKDEYEAKAGKITPGKTLSRYDYLYFLSWGETEIEAVEKVKSKIDNDLNEKKLDNL